MKCLSNWLSCFSDGKCMNKIVELFDGLISDILQYSTKTVDI